MQGSEVKVWILRLGWARFFTKIEPASSPISYIFMSTEVIRGSVKSEKAFFPLSFSQAQIVVYSQPDGNFA